MWVDLLFLCLNPLPALLRLHFPAACRCSSTARILQRKAKTSILNPRYDFIINFQLLEMIVHSYFDFGKCEIWVGMVFSVFGAA